MIGLCAFWVKSDHLVQVCTRLVELVLGSKEIPTAEVGCSVLGIDSDGLIEILHCKVVPSLLAISESPVGIGAGKMRVEFDRVAEVIDRVRVAPQFGVDDAARIVRCRITRIARNDFPQGSKIPGVGVRQNSRQAALPLKSAPVSWTTRRSLLHAFENSISALVVCESRIA